ncbi:MAG: hypothetical protein HY659_14735 [Rhizobiales bacterium]|nr:hypothetical protein [Hyphomicrobiales bacterium]
MRAWRAQKAGFNPGQPRVPAGNSGGGQWTSRDRSAQSNLDADLLESDAEDGSIDDAQLGAQSILDDAAEPSIQLVSDESESDRLLNRHISEQHIDKTDDELIARIQREQIRGIFVSTGLDRNGAFDSIESARDLIQQTINNNSDVVARVASGRSTDAFLTWRFGRVTGREAILDLQTSTVRMRKTYEVGVAIVHDPNSLSGYRIVTAYPRNYNSRIGR